MGCIGAPANKQDISIQRIPHLISFVLRIVATDDNHLLVQVSSSKTTQRSGKNLLCIDHLIVKTITINMF